MTYNKYAGNEDIKNAMITLDETLAGYYVLERIDGIYAVHPNDSEDFIMNGNDLSKKMEKAHKLDIDVELFRILTTCDIPGIDAFKNKNLQLKIKHKNYTDKEDYKNETYKSVFFNGQPLPFEHVTQIIKNINQQFPQQYVFIKLEEEISPFETIPLNVNYLEAYRILTFQNDKPHFIVKLNNIINDENNKIKSDYKKSLNKIRFLINETPRNHLIKILDKSFIKNIAFITFNEDDNNAMFNSALEYNKTIYEHYSSLWNNIHKLDDEKTKLIVEYKKTQNSILYDNCEKNTFVP
jgi:hypothetical protein